MARHRMMSDWFDPENEVRFISESGELFNAGALHASPVAAPPSPRPRRHHVAVGAPWDVIEDADILNAIGRESVA